MIAWTRDVDGDLDNLSDCELFTRTWNEGAGAWGPITRRTTDVIQDRNARLALNDAGTAYCVWQRGDDLVMDVGFSGSPTIVRADSTTLGFSDLSVSLSPGGNVVVLWGEMEKTVPTPITASLTPHRPPGAWTPSFPKTPIWSVPSPRLGTQWATS